MLYDILAEFQQDHPNIYIGGSVSLILQKIIPYRIPNDIDIISTSRTHIYDVFNVDKPQHVLIHKYKHKNFLFDLFINPQAQYVEHIYNGYTLKLSPADEIYKWKLRDKNISKKKHIEDLKYYDKI